MNRVPAEVTKERERRAWELRTKKFLTEQRIADELGVDVSTVSRMLRRVEARLAKQFETNAAEIKAQQTAQLMEVASEAREAWERSQKPAELNRRVAEEIELTGADEDGVKVAVPAEKVTTTEESRGQTGDPRFLDQMRGALADIRDIWGLNAPKKADLTSGDEPITVVIGIDPAKM